MISLRLKLFLQLLCHGIRFTRVEQKPNCNNNKFHKYHPNVYCTISNYYLIQTVNLIMISRWVSSYTINCSPQMMLIQVARHSNNNCKMLTNHRKYEPQQGKQFPPPIAMQNYVQQQTHVNVEYAVNRPRVDNLGSQDVWLASISTQLVGIPGSFKPKL